MTSADSTVLHLYGIVGDEPSGAEPASPPLEGSLPPGVGGAPVEVEAIAGLRVLASDLPTEHYGPSVWADQGQDPSWLSRVATEHHAVLQHVVEEVDVLPLRLPSLYLDRAAAERALTAEAEALRSGLEAVRGHVEVVVKVFSAAEPAGPPDTAKEEGSAPSSGREYLARRAAERTLRKEAVERRRRAVLDLHGALADGSTHAVVSPAQDASLSGRPEPMLLNGAYLVPRAELDGFRGLAGRLAECVAKDSLVVELSGPWPPYSFTSPAPPPAGAP